MCVDVLGVAIRENKSKIQNKSVIKTENLQQKEEKKESFLFPHHHNATSSKNSQKKKNQEEKELPIESPFSCFFYFLSKFRFFFVVVWEPPAEQKIIWVTFVFW